MITNIEKPMTINSKTSIYVMMSMLKLAHQRCGLVTRQVLVELKMSTLVMMKCTRTMRDMRVVRYEKTLV
jgi:hypothetical protein